MRISLNDAFHMMGQAQYSTNWNEYYIQLSPGKFRDLFAPEDIPIRRSISHPEDDIVREKQGFIFASERMIECYDGTLTTLTDVLHEEKITVFGLNIKGEENIVPNIIWKDRTNDYQICLVDSEIINKQNDEKSFFKVKLDKEQLDNCLKEVEKERQKLVRKASENTSKGGRPPEYDWNKIEKIIEEELTKQIHTTSMRKIAAIVYKRINDEMNIDPPVDSELRRRVSIVKDRMLNCNK